jgi:chromosome transmission fidelity protein 4
MHVQMQLDALGDADAPEELRRRELALDKELLQLIQSACKADRLPRALDLVRLLHHTPSFDLAMKVADFYHLRGLREKMQLLKDAHEDASAGTRRRWAADYEPVPAPRLPAAHVNGRAAGAFQDFGPPPTVYRPGLARAAPSYVGADDATAPSYVGADDAMDTRGDAPPPPQETKRKRVTEDGDVEGSRSASPSDSAAKRRALGEASGSGSSAGSSGLSAAKGKRCRQLVCESC